MPSVNELIADLAIRHQVAVQQLGSGVVRRLNPILDRANDDIVKRLLLRPRELDGSFGTKRLQALQDALRDIRRNAQVDFNKGLVSELRSIASYEATFQMSMLKRAIPVAMDIVSPTAQMLQAAVTSRPFQGALLRDWLSGAEAGSIRRIKEAITQGVIQGEPIADIVRRIRGTRANNYRDGVMAVSRRGTEAMVRTAVSHVTSEARDLLYAENTDIISKEQWLATLDTRTCPQCQGLDGKTFEVGKGAKTPAHISCRCVRIPVLKSWKEMGFDIDELPPGTRASMNGQVPANLNYNEWLKTQSPSVQDEALGPTRGAMFRRGDMTVDSFTNRQGDELTLDQLAKRDGVSLTTPVPVPTPSGVVPLTERKYAEDVPRIRMNKFTEKLKDFSALEQEMLDRARVTAARISAEAQMIINSDSKGRLKSFIITGDGVDITRLFNYGDGPKSVEHDFFSVRANLRGAGTKDFLSDTVEAYADMGFAKVTVHANIDVGGYAWLKYGFKPDRGTLNGEVIRRRAERLNLPTEQMQLIEELIKKEEYQVLADMDQLVQGKTIAKHLFLDTNWYGSLELQNGETMLRFRTYVKGKK